VLARRADEATGDAARMRERKEELMAEMLA